MSTITDKKPRYDVFKRLLEANNMSIYKIATDLGISDMTFYDWREGRSAPKTYKLIIIADYFGIDIRDFFEDE